MNKSRKTLEMEYKQKGKYLNILMPVSGVKVLRTQYVKQPVIEIQNPKYPIVAEASLIIAGNEKVGMLADYLGINRNQMRSKLRNEGADNWLNEELKSAGDRKIKIDASEFNGKLYVFTIATEIHTIVTYTAIRSLVSEMLGKESLGETNTPGRGLKWVKTYSPVELNSDSLAARIVILSGGNTLKDSIKVSTQIQVNSCQNSMICGDFSRVKHTENWRERLTSILKSAAEIATKSIDVIKMGMNRELTLSEGLNYIQNMELPVTTPEKLEKVKDALKLRFAYEFKRGTAWELSQALSYYGSHGNPEDSSDHTLEVCSIAAYQLLQAARQK